MKHLDKRSLTKATRTNAAQLQDMKYESNAMLTKVSVNRWDVCDITIF